MKLNVYTLPLLISLGLHALMLGVVTWNWESTPKPRKVETPSYVKAEIVEFSPRAQELAEQAEQQKIIDMRARRQEQERREAEQRRQQEAERQRKALEQKQEQERKQKQEAERKAEAEKRQQEQQREERERQQAQRRLDEALAREDEFVSQQQSRTMAQSYVDVIAQRIEQNWSRPPSARAGMECVLLIQLVPTGNVVNVTVAEGSGNAAFDRSAERAVERVGRFTEIQDMPPEVFERHFRQLRLVFKPKDLRL